MRDQLREATCNHFGRRDVVLNEISTGRSNTNYFIQVWREEYFLRSSITKIQDPMFWGKLRKESDIYQMLRWKGITADIVHFFDDDINLQFIITEKLQWRMPQRFHDHQQSVMRLLKDFQKVDYNQCDVLEMIPLITGFKEILRERIARVNEEEYKEILSTLMDYLYDEKWNFVEELVLCHNDFRNDNIIVSDNNAKVIDLEWTVIADKYIDAAEYYVWWVFWDCFGDQKVFDFEVYKNYMGRYWYTDPGKQKHVFIMKFCSNYAWLSAHISGTEEPLSIYTEALERNTKHYYKDIKLLLN